MLQEGGLTNPKSYKRGISSNTDMRVPLPHSLLENNLRFTRQFIKEHCVDLSGIRGKNVKLLLSSLSTLNILKFFKILAKFNFETFKVCTNLGKLFYFHLLLHVHPNIPYK